MKLEGCKGSFQQKETKEGYKYWYHVWYDPETKTMKSRYVGKHLPTVNHDGEEGEGEAKQAQNRADLVDWYKNDVLKEGDT